MKRALIIATLAALAAAQADAAAKIERLHGQRGAACTSDRTWCVQSDGNAMTVVHNKNRTVARLPMPSDADARIESQPWASIVRVALPGQPEFALVGVARTQREMYSGGGASVTHLTLFEIRTNDPDEPRAVLEAPLSGSVMIRACFSREDERRRRGACHDEYRYEATLVAPPQHPNTARLIYRSHADSFPGRRKRYDDSSREGQLSRNDLVRAVDRRCSVERNLIRNPATGAFAWSAPLPPCGDYLELQ
jgi:hypothetical protein